MTRDWFWSNNLPQIARFMRPTWGPRGSCRPQIGPNVAPWTLLSRTLSIPKASLWSHQGTRLHLQDGLIDHPCPHSEPLSMEYPLFEIVQYVWAHNHVYAHTEMKTPSLSSLVVVTAAVDESCIALINMTNILLSSDNQYKNYGYV